MTRRAGIRHWHAHEGRHTAVSIICCTGTPLLLMIDTVGHKSTHVTLGLPRDAQHVHSRGVRRAETVVIILALLALTTRPVQVGQGRFLWR